MIDINLKKLDRLIIFEILPVFVVSFLISVFVLMMQFMFLYIDEIAGKGVGIFTILEMMFYMSLTFVPMGMPISILISSVMVYGALGERYELATAKSAGISFLRMMYPSIVFALLVSVLSFICSEYIIPVANVKARSRLYDISKKKPTLNIKEGVFNTDFDGYGIRIGEKSSDGSEIKDVVLYNYNSNYEGTSNIIIAKSGEMIVTPDQKAFVMVLKDGKQYQEVKRYNRTRSSEDPFMVTSFEKYQKVFDLSDFQLQNTNENYFKDHQSTKNTRQLRSTIDSTEKKLEAQRDRIDLEISYDLPFIESRILQEREMEKEEKQDSLEKIDTIRERGDSVDGERIDSIVEDGNVNRDGERNHMAGAKRVENTAAERNKKVNTTRTQYQLDWQKLTPEYLMELSEKDSLLIEVIPNKDNSLDLMGSLRSNIQSMKDQVGYKTKQIESDRSRIVKSTYELHYKFVMSISCLIFVLIGGSMGSIVRKGGFGYSLLIAIVFFVAFIMMSITFRKLSEGYRISPVLGAYLPIIILLPIGMFLVHKAVNDSKMSLDFSRIVRYFRRVLPFLKSEKE
ncbi:LptF/LptG family permease [Membranihabitans maritimus]|uniref:LptF/LptG family permease n=1 Tax=Membranihabitans maritimus TaxID=2904244 RepID=UPI0034E1E61D